MRDFAKAFYSSETWKRTREAYLASVGYICERCKRQGIISTAEAVHHKIHLSAENIDNADITLSFDNLEALCRKCHGEEHQRKRYKVDKDGHVII